MLIACEHSDSIVCVAVWIALGEGSNERQRNFLIIFTWNVPLTMHGVHQLKLTTEISILFNFFLKKIVHFCCYIH